MIRVLRVIEYTYPDVETYWKDRQRWTMHHLSEGYGSGTLSMSSAVISEHVTNQEGNWMALAKDENAKEVSDT